MPILAPLAVVALFLLKATLVVIGAGLLLATILGLFVAMTAAAVPFVLVASAFAFLGVVFTFLFRRKGRKAARAAWSGFAEING